MNRLLIALLAAFDAAIAAAAGVVVVLAPLSVLWVFGFGGSSDWGVLWPTGASIWQLGHLVPLSITLPGDYLVSAGIAEGAASFVLSLAPLALAAFTVIFAARSGARASRADGWVTGVVAGGLAFAALTTLIAVTSRNAIASTELWQAILFPVLVFVLPSLAGAVVVEWREAGAGVIARVRDRVEGLPNSWSEVVGLAARGAAVVWVGLIGLGALGVALALVFSADEVIALFEAGHVDALGATITALAQLAYLPTLIVWAFSYIAGPGFAIGVDTAVSPAGTQIGVLPGIPVLGAVPESASPWLLLLVLLPIGIGALAGWIARSHLVSTPTAEGARVTSTAPWATEALEGLLGSPRDSIEAPEQPHGEGEPVGARLALTAAIAVVSGAGAALLAVLASGSIGPGRLSEVGPQAGPIALAVGLEVLVGAGILLLSPLRRSPDRAAAADARTAAESGVAGAAAVAVTADVAARDPFPDAYVSVADAYAGADAYAAAYLDPAAASASPDADDAASDSAPGADDAASESTPDVDGDDDATIAARIAAAWSAHSVLPPAPEATEDRSDAPEDDGPAPRRPSPLPPVD